MKKRLQFVFTLILSLFLLAACGSNNNSTENDDTEESKDMTVTDAMGEVTIPADAKNILAPYLEDSLVALGVKPVAQWAIGTTVINYLQDDLKDVPTIEWDLPLEQTIKAKPDLIVFSSESAIQNGQYDEYTKIAPTYVFKEEDASDWRKQLTVMGELLGKKDVASEKLADYDTKVKEASAKIKDAIGDESAAIIWVAGGQYYLFESDRFAGNVLYGDLGVTEPTMISELPSAESTWQAVSLESLADLDADHIFIVAKEDEAGVDTLDASSIWQGLEAVKNGNVYEMNDPSHWTINGLIANELTIDQIVESLTK